MTRYPVRVRSAIAVGTVGALVGCGRLAFEADPRDAAHDGADENSGSPQYFWHGKLDELELYDRALSDLEILGLASE